MSSHQNIFFLRLTNEEINETPIRYDINPDTFSVTLIDDSLMVTNESVVEFIKKRSFDVFFSNFGF